MSSVESDQHAVVLGKTIGATADRVFDAFTNPKELSRWFTTSAEADLRVGGRYRNADQDEGEFLVIDRPLRVHFTWENADHCPGTVVEVEFKPLEDEAVRLNLKHRGIETQEGATDMRNGWSWALDSLKSYVELGVPIPHSEWEASRLDSEIE